MWHSRDLNIFMFKLKFFDIIRGKKTSIKLKIHFEVLAISFVSSNTHRKLMFIKPPSLYLLHSGIYPLISYRYCSHISSISNSHHFRVLKTRENIHCYKHSWILYEHLNSSISKSCKHIFLKIDKTSRDRYGWLSTGINRKKIWILNIR